MDSEQLRRQMRIDLMIMTPPCRACNEIIIRKYNYVQSPHQVSGAWSP